MFTEQPADSPDGRQWGFLISQEATRQEELAGFDFETDCTKNIVYISKMVSEMLDTAWSPYCL